MTYEKRIKACASSQDERLMAILAILPSLRMLDKLLTRKNNGKKPFSAEFDYEGRIKQVHDVEKLLVKAMEEGIKEEDVSELKKVAETSLLATKEIKMESLKNDFYWICDNISSLCTFLTA